MNFPGTGISELNVIPTMAVDPGSPIHFQNQNTIFIHPLDVLFITTPDPFEHLRKAMAWITERTCRRLDAVAARLEALPIEHDHDDGGESWDDNRVAVRRTFADDYEEWRRSQGAGDAS